MGQLVRVPSLDDEDLFDDSTPQEDEDLRKRKPKWLLETLKDTATIGALKK